MDESGKILNSAQKSAVKLVQLSSLETILVEN